MKEPINTFPGIADTCHHNPMNEKLGYVAWHEWAERKTRQGHRQKQCPKCGKWLFKCEYSKQQPLINE